MNIQLSERIKENERNFSKGQRLIAKFITEHYDKVAFMTVQAGNYSWGQRTQ